MDIGGGGEGEGDLALVGGEGGVGAVVDEEGAELGPPLLRCLVKWTEAPSVHGVDLQSRSVGIWGKVGKILAEA